MADGLDTQLSRPVQRNVQRQLERMRQQLAALHAAADDSAATYFDRMHIGMLVVDFTSWLVPELGHRVTTLGRPFHGLESRDG